MELIISALALLDNRFRAVVAGSGSPIYEQYLRELAEQAGVHSRIDWRGQIDRESRSEYLGELRVLVMPSNYESFGMVAAESMAVGVPVVVSPNAGIVSIVEGFGAGYVLSEITAVAIRDAIYELSCEPDRIEQMDSRGLEAVDHNLTFDS